MTAESPETCSLCGRPETRRVLAEARWLSPEAIGRIAETSRLAAFRRGLSGVRRTLLEMLLERGENAFHESV